MKTLIKMVFATLILSCLSHVATAVTAETFRDIAKHSVNIYAEDGTGTGTIIDQHHVLTAFHVVPDKNGNYVLALPDGRVILAQVERSDEASDLSMLVTYEPLGDDGPAVANDEPLQFQPVATVGYPLNLKVAVGTEGVYNGVLPEEEKLAVFTLPITFGNSGGGIYAIDKAGHAKLAGVVHAMAVSTYIITDYPTYHLLLGISYDAMIKFLNTKLSHD